MSEVVTCFIKVLFFVYILPWTARQARLLWGLCSSSEVAMREIGKWPRLSVGSLSKDKSKGKTELDEGKEIMPRHPIALSVRSDIVFAI